MEITPLRKLLLSVGSLEGCRIEVGPRLARPTGSIKFDWIGAGDLCIILRLRCDPDLQRKSTHLYWRSPLTSSVLPVSILSHLMGLRAPDSSCASICSAAFCCFLHYNSKCFNPPNNILFTTIKQLAYFLILSLLPPSTPVFSITL